MVASRKLIAVLLLVLLPTLIAARSRPSTSCKVSVSQKLTDTSSRYYTYRGTITNVGSLPVTSVTLTPSDDLESISGLSGSNRYTYGNTIAVDDDYSFTYTVRKGNNIKWDATVSCSSAATAAPTTKPTSKPTSAPTSKPTKAPTAAPTSKPTNAATAKPTTKPTSAPTSKPTSAPTTKPTSAPTTTKPTSAPAVTVPPVAGGNGRRCPAGTWWAPAPQTTYQWQLTGNIDQSVNVQMYDIDLFDNSAATISSLHSAGRVVICYFSTQYEDWRPDASAWSASALGNNLDDWAGERYVDIRSSVVRNAITARLDLAVSKGCDGVEPDNVDGYQAKTGFPLTAADQINFNTFIANEAHKRGLSVGLKNDLDQATALQPVFDWALNEQCAEYSECSMLNVFIQKGKAVFNTEYSGSASKVCPSMVTSKFSSLIKKLDLDASITAQCCSYQSGGCAAVPYKCVSSMSSRDVDEVEEVAEVEQVEEVEEVEEVADAEEVVVAEAEIVEAVEEETPESA